MKLPRGQHADSKNLRDITNVFCKLELDFNGAARLRAKADNVVYSADLLIDETTVVAVSLKTEAEEFSGDTALSELGDRLFYSSGKVDFFRFDDSEMRRAVKNNTSKLLSVGVAPSEIEINVNGKRVGICDTEPSLKKISRRIWGLASKKKTGNAGRKYRYGNLADEIKKKYGLREDGKKKAGKPSRGGPKVKTSIDELYELIKEKKTLKVTDALAKRFKVGKKQVVEWAEILEKHGMAEIHYSTIGQTEIKIAGKKEGEPDGL